MTVRPITDQLAQAGNSQGYRLPAKVCASCGCSTSTAMHVDCKRDPRGRLLVIEEAA